MGNRYSLPVHEPEFLIPDVYPLQLLDPVLVQVYTGILAHSREEKFVDRLEGHF